MNVMQAYLVVGQTWQAAALELRGADFDWDNWAGLPPDKLAERKAATALLLREAPPNPFVRAARWLRSRCRRAEKVDSRPDTAEAPTPGEKTSIPITAGASALQEGPPGALAAPEDAEVGSLAEEATADGHPAASRRSLASSAGSRRSMEVKYKGPTLQAPMIAIPPGQLVGICGEVSLIT